MFRTVQSKIYGIFATAGLIVVVTVILVAFWIQGAMSDLMIDSLSSTSDVQDALREIGIARNIGIVGLSAFVGVLCVSAVYLSRRISGFVHESDVMVHSMSQGHINRRLKFSNNDDLAQTKKALNDFANVLETEVMAPMLQLAQGDLTFEANPFDNRDVLRGSIKQLCTDLNKTMRLIKKTASEIGTASGSLADSSTRLSQGTTESAASLQEIAASMNEISGQTTAAAERAKRANVLSSEAHQAASDGKQQMEEMIVAIKEINEAGENIGKIIKVIDDIAFQTNMLALNAAVEAARAGKHGKGFAVVAEEVRSLAYRSAKAAQETTELIEASVEKSTKGNVVAEKTFSDFGRIVDLISKAAIFINEIADSSNEQAVGIKQINIGLSQIDLVIQQNTVSAEAAESTSGTLATLSRELNTLLQRFALAGDGPAKLIRWTDDLNTGVPEMDRQHQRLIELINGLFDAMKKNSEQSIIAKHVDGLAEYTVTHFDQEEQLMARYHYPEIEAHKRIHKKFVAKVNEFNKRIHSEERVSAADIITFLKDWLISHIQHKDRDGYAVLVRALRAQQQKADSHQPMYFG